MTGIDLGRILVTLRPKKAAIDRLIKMLERFSESRGGNERRDACDAKAGEKEARKQARKITMPDFIKSGYPLYSSDARRHVWSRTRMDAGGHSTGESRRFYRFLAPRDLRSNMAARTRPIEVCRPGGVDTPRPMSRPGELE